MTEKIEKGEEHSKGSSPDLRSKSAKEDQDSDAKVPIQMKPLERKLTGWAEHTWSTFIKRAEEEEEAVAPQGKLLLSTFQQDKFVHFFYHVLDINQDHVISQEDFNDLNDRVRHYMDWSVNNPRYLTLIEVHNVFIKYFLKEAEKFVPTDTGFEFNGPGEEEEDEEALKKTSVSIQEWVSVWGETVGQARKMDDLPMWLQYYPKKLFDTINRSGSGVITKMELKLFYTAFLDAGKMEDEALIELTHKSYSAMTSNGESLLTFHLYKLSFLNFLLGRQPNGPGQSIFGQVEGNQKEETKFHIDYTCLDSSSWSPETKKNMKKTASAVKLIRNSCTKSVVV